VLEFVGVEIGTGQPHGCVLCGQATVGEYNAAADVAALIRTVAEGWTAGPGPNIVLTGPEPFAHPELPALVAACVEAGVERIALATDGAALSVSANAVGVLRAGVRHLRIRLLDIDEARGDACSGSPGVTRDALAGVRAYLAAAEDDGVAAVVTAIVPVCRHNLQHLPEIVAGAASAGFAALRLTHTEGLPGSAGALLAAACDTGMVNRLWVEADPALPLPATHVLHSVEETVRFG